MHLILKFTGQEMYTEKGSTQPLSSHSVVTGKWPKFHTKQVSSIEDTEGGGGLFMILKKRYFTVKQNSCHKNQFMPAQSWSLAKSTALLCNNAVVKDIYRKNTQFAKVSMLSKIMILLKLPIIITCRKCSFSKSCNFTSFQMFSE